MLGGTFPGANIKIRRYRYTKRTPGVTSRGARFIFIVYSYTYRYSIPLLDKRDNKPDNNTMNAPARVPSYATQIIHSPTAKPTPIVTVHNVPSCTLCGPDTHIQGAYLVTILGPLCTTHYKYIYLTPNAEANAN